MNTNFKTLLVGLSLLGGLTVAGGSLSAQIISVSGLSSTPTTIESDGNFTSTEISSLSNATIAPPTNLDLVPTNGGTPTSTFGQTSGWAFSGTQGNMWIASSTVLTDPSIFYSVAFQNTTNTTETYEVTYSVPISPAESFSPAYVRSTVAGSLVNGGSNANVPAVLTPVLASTTGAGGPYLQTSTLTNVLGGTASTNVDLNAAPVLNVVSPSGTVMASGDGGNVTFIGQTPGYNAYSPTGPTGTFNALNVTLGFTLTAGDEASFTGRVDVVNYTTNVVPEPSNAMLCLLGFGSLALITYLRRVRQS
jgi:hypothetical protein